MVLREWQKRQLENSLFQLLSNSCLFHIGASQCHCPRCGSELRLCQQQCRSSLGARRRSLHQIRWRESPWRKQQQIQHIFWIYYLCWLIVQKRSVSSQFGHWIHMANIGESRIPWAAIWRAPQLCICGGIQMLPDSHLYSQKHYVKKILKAR